MEYVHSLGLSSGLLAALTWAIASFLFRKIGVSLPPLTLNLYKGVIASIVLSAIFLVKGDLMTMLHKEATLLLIVSGFIGIGIGDSAFFASLNRLGEQRSVLIAETAAPVITIFIAIVFLQEFISLQSWIGIIIIMYGVYLVINLPSPSQKASPEQKNLPLQKNASEQSSSPEKQSSLDQEVLTEKELQPKQTSDIEPAGSMEKQLAPEKSLPEPQLPPAQARQTASEQPPTPEHVEKNKKFKAGIIFALVAAICQAIGGIMSKAAFRIDDIDPLFSSLIRLTGGIAFLIFFIPIHQKGLLPILPLTRRIAFYIMIASLIGTFGGIVFQQMAFKYTYTAAAQTLIATSSIFIIFIGMLAGVHPTRNATIGVILAIFGIGVLFY